MIIRKEKKEDYFIVENLIRDAFWNVNFPGANEHYLAHEIRKHCDFVDELDYVIEENGKIIGSIMYTLGKIRSENGKEKDCLTFGPLAIAPEHQRKGMGKKLMEVTLNKAKELGYESVIIFGHPTNYISSGFVSCKKMNVCIGNNLYPTSMLVKPLVENAFNGEKWFYEESKAYEINIEEVEKFDKLFPYKEKKTLPCQEEFYIYSHSFIK